MLHVHFGNRIEALADALAEVLARPADPDPLRPETVVVGHGGMGEWLKRALARRLGIAANLALPYPASFIWSLLRALDPELPRASPLDRGPLAWRLYAVLARPDPARAAPLARYLADGDALAPFELARALAAVFEQYQIYRPGWIRAWEAGAAGDLPDGRAAAGAWQAALWRAAAAGALPDPAQLLSGFARRAGELAAAPAVPARIAVFGLSALPPAYLGMLQALAAVREVHLFVPNPSREYWGDIADEAVIARWRARGRRHAEHRAVGHPLLAALGAQNRDFVDLVIGAADAAEFHEHYAEPEGTSLLARVQSDLLALAMPAPVPPASADGSIAVHVCHSRMREVEVLHDRLLARFEADPALGPEDVLVMAPDIADYADSVAAVFDGVPRERRIPWSLADRGARGEHPIPEAFLELMALPESRFTASEIVGLLELPAVARRFELAPEALARIARWVEAADIRWGLDGAHRAELALPAEPLFTWRFGLERLLAGYALAPDETQPWHGIAPWGALEGQGARALGALAGFVAQLAGWRAILAAPHTPAGWAECACAVLSLFAPAEADELEAVDAVRAAIAAFADEAALAGCEDELPPAVARAALAEKLAIPRRHQPFLAGRVTFCSLVPMRSIPARVVWLLGMSDRDFPRRGRAPGFDLIAAAPRRGDRARRSEDRALFLEALCAARAALHLSYVGRSERDDSPLPPSVVVSELLDVAARMGAEEKALVVEHPLQPFSARYRADDPRRASYAREWLTRGSPPPAEFATQPLAREPDEVISIAELIDGLAHPARRLLRALGIARAREPAFPPDEEPFALAALEAWRVRDELLARTLAADARFDAWALYDEFAARALLVPGEAGRLAFAQAAAEVAPLAARVRALTKGRAADTVDVALALAGVRLEGRIAEVYPETGHLRARAAKLRAHDRLALWVEHLALAATGRAQASRLVALDAELALGPVADPAAELAWLCELHARAAREPLPLLPDLSLEFYAAERKKDAEAALRKVRAIWNDAEHPRYEAADPDCRLALRGEADPFGKEFMELARRLFGAIAAHATGDAA